MAAPYIVTPELVTGSFNAVIYGDQGVGKTVFAAGAQEHKAMKDVLFVNVEGGLMSISGKKGITAVDITSVLQKPDDQRGEDDISFEEIFWHLHAKDKGWSHFKTIIIDSVTELQTMNLEEIVRDSIRKNSVKYKNRTPDEIFQEDYGKSTAQLKRLFRYFRDLPLNVIWTALPKYSYPKGATDTTNIEPMSVTPSLTDKLGGSLMGFVDFVWYMYLSEDDSGNVHRHLLTQARGPFKAKTRGMKFAEALGAKVDEPDLAKLYAQFLSLEAK